MPLFCFHFVEVCGVQWALVERRVRSLGIIEADPVINDQFGLEAVSNFMQVNGLLFKGTPEPFDEDVVQVAASAIH